MGINTFLKLIWLAAMSVFLMAATPVPTHTPAPIATPYPTSTIPPLPTAATGPNPSDPQGVIPPLPTAFPIPEIPITMTVVVSTMWSIENWSTLISSARTIPVLLQTNQVLSVALMTTVIAIVIGFVFRFVMSQNNGD